MTAKVILNPYANRWNAGQHQSEVEALLRQAGIDFDLTVTQQKQHATQIAAEAIQKGFSTIIACGGDGTIGEVVNGIAQGAGDQDWPTLGLIPLGTANDLVHNLKLPADLEAMTKILAAGHTRMMDICQVNDFYFVNNAAIGLEADISIKQNAMTWFKGIPRYLAATLWGIWENPSWETHLEWEGGEYYGPISLVSVGNHVRTGGLFYMTPNANGFDGKLTFSHGYVSTRRRMLALLPKTTRSGEGSFIEQPEVQEISSPYLRITCQPPTPLHADGEVIYQAVSEIEFKVLPQKIPVLMP